MRHRFDDADASPIFLAAKRKKPSALPNEVTNGSNAAAMICRRGPDIERCTWCGELDVIGQTGAREVRQETL
jgi:hypothetical protein